MDSTLPLGETATGPGATGPGGRPVSVPVGELTRSLGLIAGDGGGDTAAVLVDALADRGTPVVVLDCDGTLAGSIRAEGRSWHGGPDADRRLEAGSADEAAGRALESDSPTLVDGRDTDDAAVAELTSSLVQRAATLDRPLVGVVSGLSTVLPDEEPVDELGRAVRRLITRGPDRGVGVCAVTDRPAAVTTAVREASAWSVWHRLSRTADTSVVRRELGGERAQAVRDLDPDEAFLETEWTAAVERISVRRRDGEPSRSDDSTAVERPPERGRSAASDGDPSDLEALAERLEELVATVETGLDPERLAADVADALAPRLESSGDTFQATNGSNSVADAGESADDGFAGFDLFDEDGGGEPEPEPEGDQSTADGLAALAGVGDERTGTPTPGENGEGERAVSDGGLDVEGVTAEIPTFEGGAAAVEMTAERSGGKPAVVVDVESRLSALEDAATGMLDHYRGDGPARPAAAHAAATGQDARVPAYTLNRQLRRAGLVEHVGRGRYDYSLRERIAAGLPPDRDEEMVGIYARDLEGEFLD